MLSAKKFYWIAQIIGWSAYCGLLALSVFNDDPNRVNSAFLFNIFIVVFTGIAVTHAQRTFFIRFGWLSLRLPNLLPRLLLSSFVCSTLISLIDIVYDYLSDLDRIGIQILDLSNIIVNVFAIMILVMFWNAIYFTFHFFQKSRKQEVSNLELEASNRESALKNLRSQLNPHFLFNSLNSIRALIDIDPIKAKTSVTTLSNLLRQSLVLGKEHLVTLEDELILAKNYLELEKVRFEERLQIEWELIPELESFQIPPFTLQMMVENSIKHGISNLKNGGIVKVRVFKTSEAIVIEVLNSGSLKSVVDLGVGIKNIKQRLLLQYGENAQFHLFEDSEMVVAQMKFII